MPCAQEAGRAACHCIPLSAETDSLCLCLCHKQGSESQVQGGVAVLLAPNATLTGLPAGPWGPSVCSPHLGMARPSAKGTEGLTERPQA